MRWIPRLSRLQTLSLWQGSALEDGVEKLILKHCPNFKNLTFYEWSVGILIVQLYPCTSKGNCITLTTSRNDTTVDDHLATFLQGLQPNSLESFQIFSASDIGPKSFTALSHHAASLTDLKLSGLKSHAIHNLNNLKACTALKTLHLEDANGISQLETHYIDTFLEIVDWLRSCKDLADLRLRNFNDGPSLLTPLLLENNPSLTRLSLEGYAMTQHRQFHQALAHATHLESLWLKGDGEDVVRDDIDALVDALCALTNLKDLMLKEVSDYFRDEHISRLIQSLPQLEELWTSGYDITDGIWPSFTQSHNLRSLTFYAMTSFTANGILDFIVTLGPSNKGFLLSIMNADVDSNLTEEEQNSIRETLAVQLDGKFEFTLMRGTLYLIKWAL